MKTLILLLFLMAAVALPVGWSQHKALTIARKVHYDLLAKVSTADSIRISHREPSIRQDRAHVKVMVERLGKIPHGDEEQFKDSLRQFRDLDPSLYLAFFEEVQSHPEIGRKNKEGILIGVLFEFMKEHPAQTLDYFLKVKAELPKADGFQFVVLNSGINQWAKEDPPAALVWMQENRDQLRPRMTKRLIQSIFTQASRQNPQETFAMLASLKDMPDLQTSVVTKLGQRLHTPEELVGFYEAYRSHASSLSADQDSVSEGALSAFAPALPRLSFSIFEEKFSSLDLADTEKASLARHLAHGNFEAHNTQEPALWADWVRQNSEADRAEDNLSEFVKNWTLADFQSTALWLNAQSEGRVRDLLTWRFADTVAPYEPAAAAEWALTLPDSEQRASLLKRIHSEWKKKDPAAAKVLEGAR